MTTKRRLGNFYGRRVGQATRHADISGELEVFQRLKINDQSIETTDKLKSQFPASCDKIWLEIGFGAGEHLLAQAEKYPDIGFIGVEPFVDGLVKAIRVIQAKDIQNIRLYDRDAWELILNLPDHVLDRICLFYPDPWRKKRHYKRRFIQNNRMNEFARILKSKAEFQFVSDWPDYVNWTIEQFHQSDLWTWDARSVIDFKTPFQDWVETRYERKAKREGRMPHYLTFRLIND